MEQSGSIRSDDEMAGQFSLIKMLPGVVVALLGTKVEFGRHWTRKCVTRWNRLPTFLLDPLPQGDRLLGIESGAIHSARPSQSSQDKPIITEYGSGGSHPVASAIQEKKKCDGREQTDDSEPLHRLVGNSRAPYRMIPRWLPRMKRARCRRCSDPGPSAASRLTSASSKARSRM